MGTRWLRMVTALLITATIGWAQQPEPTKPPVPPTPKVASRVLELACGDTVLDAMGKASEAFGKVSPERKVTVHGGGSGAALAALAAGKAQLAVTTRPATDAQLASARDQGFEPMQQVIGYHQMAIVVPKSNPIESLTMAQLAEIWGDQGPTTKWSQLGVTLAGEAAAKVQVVGPQVDNGSHLFFRVAVLGARGSLRKDIATVNSSKDLVELVARTPAAIGFCQVEYAVGKDVRVVPIAAKAGDKPALPTAVDGYPLQRAIYVYFRDEPDGAAKAFAKWLVTSDAIRTLR